MMFLNTINLGWSVCIKDFKYVSIKFKTSLEGRKIKKNKR
jgi:hypothetical protein